MHHYMGTHQQTQTTVPRGLFSNAERAFLRGENEVEDPDGYKRNLRHRAKKQMDRIEDDLELAEEAGQEDLVDEFHNRFSRYKQLEREVQRLRSELEAEREGEDAE